MGPGLEGNPHALVFAIDNCTILPNSETVHDLRNLGIGYSADPLRESTSEDK